jgi:glyoxylase-like metal-dependent hydrolase (beta-lactamase superfamily II)
MINRLTNGLAGGKHVIAPNRTVNDGDVISIGDTKFRIHHQGAAHTDGDIMIEIVGADTLFTGDIVRNGMFGLMESDGSFEGNISMIDWAIEKDFMFYIPGHGTSGGKEILVDYRTYLTKLLSTVRQLYDEGLADYEMKPAVEKALSAFKNWEGFSMRLGSHVSRAFLQVEEEAF